MGPFRSLRKGKCGLKATSLGSIENTSGKEENAGYQHFFLFPTMF